MDERRDAYRLLMADVYELAGRSRASSERVAADQGLTAARWHVMSVVSGEPCNVPAAARRLGLTRQSVQRVVNDLEREHLVTLEPNPAHERSALVTLTDRGREAVDQLFARSAASRDRLLDRAGLGTAELMAAREVARALVAAFDDEEA